MLPLAEVHALASMLAADDWAFDLEEVEAVVGLPCHMDGGTCKSVLVLADQWVIKYTKAWSRSGAEEEQRFLDALEAERPHLVRYFLKTHQVTEQVQIQECLTVLDRDEFEPYEEEVYSISEEAGVADVFYRNVGFRRDGTWAIFDFDA